MRIVTVKPGGHDALSRVNLGRQGEHNVTQVRFDISRMEELFGEGAAELLCCRPGDPAPYPVALEREGNFVVWTVTATDTEKSGTGKAEMRWYVGQALAKSNPYLVFVDAAMGATGAVPDPPGQTWLDQALEVGAQAKSAAQQAKAAAEEAKQGFPTVSVDATLSVSGKAADARAVGDAIDKLSQEIENLPTDSVEVDATLSVAGKAADAKAVGDALETVNATNIYIGENTSTTVDGDGNVTTVEGSSDSGSSGSFAQWQHLATVDYSDEANQLQHTSFAGLNNVTEIFVKLNGVQSADTSTASNFYLKINNTQVAANILPINKSGTVQYSWFYAKYNGLVWLPIKPSAGAIADTNVTPINLQVPYELIFGVGAASEFSLDVANVSYKPVTGTLEVYVR